MPATLTLSTDAMTLLRLRLARQSVDVTDETREAYRELAQAGIMMPISTFAHGEESRFMFTQEGWARREEFLSVPSSSRHPGKQKGSRNRYCDFPLSAVTHPAKVS